jgi:hypothetical protein
MNAFPTNQAPAIALLWRAQQGQGMPATSAGCLAAPSRPRGPTTGGIAPRSKEGHDTGRMHHRPTSPEAHIHLPPWHHTCSNLPKL